MQKKLLVIKIGTATLTKATEQISRGKMEDLARQILVLREEYDVVLVSSGAIATAKQFVQLSGGNQIVVKQALAAIGQPLLMRMYQEVFSDFGLPVAQCLLNYRHFDNDNSKENILSTLHVLLDNNYVPVINENDTVATQEIEFGDNDKLAAYTAVLLKAHLLLLASDIDGLHDSDPKSSNDARLIRTVTNLQEVMKHAGESSSGLGTGGMKSKLEAAQICTRHGVEMWIVNGQNDGFAVKALNGEGAFTRFMANGSSASPANL